MNSRPYHFHLFSSHLLPYIFLYFAIIQAIMLAASRPDIELMAVNCVAGRVCVLNACENALRILKSCGREDVGAEIL